MAPRSAVGRLLHPGLRVWRSVAGKNSRVERVLRNAYGARRRATSSSEGEDFRERSGPEFLFVESKARPGPRVGIFLKGGCDLPTLFSTAPQLRRDLRGSCCIYRHGIGISDSRPDIMLQSASGIPAELTRGVTRGSLLGELGRISSGDPYMGLPVDYFQPVTFEPTFTVPGLEEAGEFPKTVVVLSLGGAVARTAYRHRQHGYLVDPGGFWLNESMDKVLADLDTATWFKDNFTSVGKLSPEAFAASFGELVRKVKADTGAAVLVYNLLVVDPSNPTHNYQFVRRSQALRRRQIDLELRALSAELDFHIVDVDRVLKREGVAGQSDFSHLPMEYVAPMAAEAYRVLREDMGVL